MNNEALLKHFKNDVDAILLLSDYNRLWFTNLATSAGYLIVTPYKSTIFLDGRYITAGKEKITTTNIKLLKKNDDFILD